MKGWLLFAIMTSMASVSLFTPAFAQSCFEFGNCTNTDNFLEWSIAPYEYILGDFTFPLVWGLVVGLLYIKTGNSQLTTIVGIFLLTGLSTTDSYLNSDTNQLYYWAIVITAVAFGCSTFYLLKVRVVQPV